MKLVSETIIFFSRYLLNSLQKTDDESHRPDKNVSLQSLVVETGFTSIYSCILSFSKLNLAFLAMDVGKSELALKSVVTPENSSDDDMEVDSQVN